MVCVVGECTSERGEGGGGGGRGGEEAEVCQHSCQHVINYSFGGFGDTVVSKGAVAIGTVLETHRYTIGAAMDSIFPSIFNSR